MLRASQKKTISILLFAMILQSCGDKVSVVDEDEEQNQSFPPISENLTVNLDIYPDNELNISPIFYDPKNQDVSLGIDTEPKYGHVSIVDNRTIKYIATESFIEDDSFTYRVTDSDGEISISRISIALNVDVKLAPTAENVDLTIDEFPTAPLTITPNFSDPQQKKLTLSISSEPKNGVLTLNTDNTFSYIPHEGYWGIDTMTYSVSDTDGNKVSKLISINYSPTPIQISFIESKANKNAGMGFMITSNGVINALAIGTLIEYSGDINGDGFSDFSFVNSSNADDYSYIFLGKKNNKQFYEFDELDTYVSKKEVIKSIGPTYSIGDVDKDGFSDLLATNTIIYGASDIPSLLNFKTLPPNVIKTTFEDGSSSNIIRGPSLFSSIQQVTKFRSPVSYDRNNLYAEIGLGIDIGEYSIPIAYIPKNQTIDLPSFKIGTYALTSLYKYDVNTSITNKVISGNRLQVDNTEGLVGLGIYDFNQNVWVTGEDRLSWYTSQLPDINNDGYHELISRNGDMFNLLNENSYIYLSYNEKQDVIVPFEKMIEAKASYNGNEGSIFVIEADDIIVNGFGTNIVDIGDIDGDGFQDFGFAVQGLHSGVGFTRNDLILIFGQTEKYPSVINVNKMLNAEDAGLRYAILNMHEYGHTSGFELTAIGDFNNDGFDDFSIQLPFWRTGSEEKKNSDINSSIAVVFGGKQWRAY
jgi:hypothetical protein